VFSLRKSYPPRADPAGEIAPALRAGTYETTNALT